MNAHISRRDILKGGLASAGLLLFPQYSWTQPKSFNEDPHFFLHLYLFGGADPAYLFDARPLAMTKAGLIQNYLGQEPELWTGRNGGTCLATRLTDPLKPFRDELSIINGVVMAHDFVGHPQNLNFLYTGNVFGGESFIPHLNQPQGGHPKRPVDAIQSGLLFVALTNASNIVPLDPDSTRALLENLAASNPMRPGDELTEFMRSRLVANSSGGGRFSAGAAQMLTGFDAAPSLQNQLSQVKPPDKNQASEQQFVSLLSEFFRNGVTRSAIYSILEPFDVHFSEAAKNQPAIFAKAVSRVAKILQAMKDTPYDSHRSMFDVTTVMVATEFGRTMRQLDAPDIDNTGTDHNPFMNSILLGGKGIKGELVVGATDLQAAEEPLSKAHQTFDKDRNLAFGRPFDFTQMRPRTDLPEKFDLADYLTIGSVVNTVYDLFQVPTSRHRTLDRNGAAAPVLKALLS